MGCGASEPIHNSVEPALASAAVLSDVKQTVKPAVVPAVVPAGGGWEPAAAVEKSSVSLSLSALGDGTLKAELIVDNGNGDGAAADGGGAAAGADAGAAAAAVEGTLPAETFASVRAEDYNPNLAEVKLLCDNCSGASGLVAILSSKDDAAIEQAAWALRNLAWNEALATSMAQAGAVNALVAVLGSSHEGVQEMAAKALWLLAWTSGANRDAIISAAAIPILQGLQQSSPNDDVKHHAGRVLNYLPQ